METTGTSILQISTFLNFGLTKGAHIRTSKGSISFTSDTTPPSFCYPTMESTAQADRFYSSIAYSCPAALPGHSPPA